MVHHTGGSRPRRLEASARELGDVRRVVTGAGSFGSPVVLADTSAWGRASLPSVSARWSEAVRRGEILTSPVVELELLFAARDRRDLELREDRLAPFRRLALTAAVARG